MKRLPIFIAGVTFGVLVTIAKLYYDVLSKQPQPKIEVDNNGYVKQDDNLYDMTDAEVKDFLEGMKSLEDTQPVKVEDEVGAWQLDQWAKEAE